MFDTKTLADIKQRLLDTQRELKVLEATGDEAAAIVTLDQSCVGRVSRMDAMQGQAMSQEARRRRGIELQKISSALQRIDAGDYGYCASCDEAIAIQRLQHDPAATLCIECASKAESQGN